MSAPRRDARLAAAAHDLAQPLAALTNLLAAMQIAIDRGDPVETVAPLLASAVAQGARARDLPQRLQDQVGR